ncbi:MAG: hypothetical protein UR12_C0017G0001 [candidate division TM6 bacterium GW2011_GWF2_30_66]|jgi:hypothetical protein|nr:MAG: hypothetical protein UR12_C0017G0001 [candidate division TM6 bacterium GW2011_GWF2_30_66]
MNTKKILLTGIFTILIFSKPSFTMNNCQNKVKECPICYEDKNSQDLHTMSCCGMTFCKKCLKQGPIRFTTKELNIENLKCPNGHCRLKISTSDIKNIATEKELEIIKKLEIINAIAYPEGFQHCPTPDCDGGFISNKHITFSNKPIEIKCSECNRSYCSNCLIGHSQEFSCDEAFAMLALFKKVFPNNQLCTQKL